MPDLDSGHIFLTTLAPIKPGAPKDDPQTSFEQRARIALAEMPTAHQSPATEHTKFNSPFARNTRTHLARMFVLNDVVYNGRNTQNPLVARLKGSPPPVIPQHVDQLNTPYLVFCADVDAVMKDGEPLPTNLSVEQQREVRASYSRKLWDTMEEELCAVYSNCYGFEEVNSAEQFAEYLDKCHVETTMPFHDYYLELPKFHNLPLMQLIIGAAAPLAIGLLLFVLWLFGAENVPFTGLSSLATALIFVALGLFLAVLFVRYAIRNGEKPLAPAKYDDLPSVLKSLYLQQKFADFFIESQGKSNVELHTAFGEFMAEHEPLTTGTKTQKPGVISSANPANVIS
ncbi:hypothetical protein [uncultured Ruegeria sp.]|uniref:hypothetical protein n=1 Tax=uncultured Ruegeria sp. TaxID=259304 RepID=UPI00262384BF|nr:hypothetical protein [uncultured Ruegeria sp.]